MSDQQVTIVPGPDGDPIVTPVTTDDDNAPDDSLTPGVDSIEIGHTFAYYAGNQVQYSRVAVKYHAKPGDTIGSLFTRVAQTAFTGVFQEAEDMATEINNRKSTANRQA